MNDLKPQIESIKAKVSLRDVVGRYRELRQVSSRWVCLCPFHDDTDPSLYVNEDTQMFKCFGCQESGDVISFIQKIEGLEFMDALKLLAAEAGVSLDVSKPQEAKGLSRKSHLAINRAAQDYYASSFFEAAGTGAREYIRNRGISEEIIAKFSIGYSPEGWQSLCSHLKGREWSEEQGVQAKLLHRSGNRVFDLFRDRIMFPIQDVVGNILGFGARTLSGADPKYINSSESSVFKKGAILYGLPQARMAISASREAILTEGYMDVASMHQFGFESTVGVLGTALTRDHVRKLMTFADSLVLIFDGDSAGRKAAFKSCSIIAREGLKSKVVLLPEGEDVDSLLQSCGRSALDACIEKGVEGVIFCMEELKTEASPRRIVEWTQQFLAGLSDPRLRAFYVPKLARSLDLSEAELRKWEECRDLAEAEENFRMPEVEAPLNAPPSIPDTAPSEEDEKLISSDKEILLGFVLNPMYLKSLEEKAKPLLMSDWGKALFEKLLSYSGGDVDTYLEKSEREYYRECLSVETSGDKILKWYNTLQHKAEEVAA